MSGTTPINGIQYPTGTDAPDITAEFATVSSVIDSRMVPRFTNAASRNAAITSPTAGQWAYLTAEGALTYYTGSAWIYYLQNVQTVKPTTEADSTYVMQDDDHLKFYALANSVYHVDAYLLPYSTNTTNDRAVQVAWSVPSGTTAKRIATGGRSTGAVATPSNMNSRAQYTTNPALAEGYGAYTSSAFTGTIEEFVVFTTSATAGYITLRFCQHPSAPASLSGGLRSSSHLRVRKVV